MKLIIGLGNPGLEHQDNRHNVGHMVVDVLLTKTLNGVVVKKTTVFMNTSGEEVKALVNKYKIAIENLYIVHDDLDIVLGQFKIQKGVGPKLHNGLTSIENKLGTEAFWRVRIGVDNRKADNRIPGEEYVLEDFSQEEKLILKRVINEATKELSKSINHD